MTSIRDIEIQNKRILVRVDFNVPLDKNGDIVDDSRIIAHLSTIGYLLANGAKVILASHLGNPKGQIVENLRMNKISLRLQELLDERMEGRKVVKLNAVAGEGVNQIVNAMDGNQIIVLENLRFHPGEEGRDRAFAKELSTLADYFVEDAFSVCHRNHTSVALIPEFIPSYSGFELERELSALSDLRNGEAKHPYVIILGGAKIDKLSLADDLAKRADSILVGGILANEMIKEAKEGQDKIVLPIDGITEANKIVETFDLSKEVVGEIRDIGPETIKHFCQIITKSKTIVWDGPLGKIEDEKFEKGTKEIAYCISASIAHSVVGGGDTLAIIKRYGMDQHFDFISMGGGATLEYIAGRKLPGIETLN